MANDLDTMPGDEMDVDIDIDLGPIDVFPEGDLNELVRGIWNILVVLPRGD